MGERISSISYENGYEDGYAKALDMVDKVLQKNLTSPTAYVIGQIIRAKGEVLP